MLKQILTACLERLNLVVSIFSLIQHRPLLARRGYQTTSVNPQRCIGPKYSRNVLLGELRSNSTVFPRAWICRWRCWRRQLTPAVPFRFVLTRTLDHTSYTFVL